MRNTGRGGNALRRELAELRFQLNESENMLRAIRAGEVDAIVVETEGRDRLFILEGAEQPYREMVEAMSEGAITVTPDGIILYCNQRFADMAKADLQTIIGSSLLSHCMDGDTEKVTTAFRESDSGTPRIRATLLASDATLVPINIAMRSQRAHGTPSIAIVVTDLTKWREAEEARERAIRALRIMNACSAAMIHAADESHMLAGICQAIVDVGGYKFAWVGYAEDGLAKISRRGPRAARNGNGGEVLGIDMAAGETRPDTGHDRVSIDMAIHNRRLIIARDTEIQPDTGSWLRLTQDTGYRSSVTVPLWMDDDVFGAWVICSNEPDAFDLEELELLTGVADDVAFGILAQRNKNARSRLAAIVESGGDAIVGRDFDGLITSWNNSAERLFGYRADEIVGRPMALLCPRELNGESAWLFEKVRRGEAAEQFETIRLSRDGRRIDVSLTISPIRSEAGDIVAAAVFMRDITAQRNVEEALRFRESAMRVEADKLRSILDSMADAIIVADKDGNIIESNPAASLLHGIYVPHLTVKDWAASRALYLADQTTPLSFDENPLVQAVQGQDTYDVERYFKRSDGTGVHVSLTGRSIRAGDGSVVGGLVVLADITERKATEAELLLYRRNLEELVSARTADLTEANRSNAELERVGRQLEQARGMAEQANQAKSRFLAGITHELRTPLHGILGYAELLSLEGDLNPAQSQRVMSMIAAGEHLLGTINAVLDV
jgi:PAS domain S-box-containing protein